MPHSLPDRHLLVVCRIAAALDRLPLPKGVAICYDLPRRNAVTVKRSDLLSHLRETRFGPGDASGARRDAERIAAFLKERYGAEVWGIGSLFEEIRPFRKGSDIDLVARGIPKDRFFDALGEVEGLTSFEVDLVPWEDANDLVREIVRDAGVRL